MKRRLSLRGAERLSCSRKLSPKEKNKELAAPPGLLILIK
jgi:hypothetical protein